MAAAFEVIPFETREEWLELRRLGIGGSDAAGVLGVSPFSSPVSVFADKVLGSDDKDNEQMYWGRTLEPVILAHYGRETGREVRADGRLLRSREWPFMQVTLDGLQSCPERGEGFVEVKNKRFPDGAGVPEHEWIQVQHQYAVTGLAWGSYAQLCTGCAFFWIDVPRDDQFILETLVPACRAMWERVEARGPTPSPDASQATLDALNRIYPKDDGETIELGGDFLDVDMERQRIAAELADLEQRKLGIDNAIRAKLGDATTGVLPNGRKYTWKARKDGVRVLRAPKAEEAA